MEFLKNLYTQYKKRILLGLAAFVIVVTANTTNPVSNLVHDYVTQASGVQVTLTPAEQLKLFTDPSPTVQ